jgi:hypothetical protein
MTPASFNGVDFRVFERGVSAPVSPRCGHAPRRLRLDRQLLGVRMEVDVPYRRDRGELPGTSPALGIIDRQPEFLLDDQMVLSLDRMRTLSRH